MADTTEVIYADRDRCCDDRNRGYGYPQRIVYEGA